MKYLCGATYNINLKQHFSSCCRYCLNVTQMYRNFSLMRTSHATIQHLISQARMYWWGE